MNDLTPLRDDVDRLERVMRLRRDVRHFRPDPVDPALLDRALAAAATAPSVGFSQPWRFVRIDDPQRRAAIIASHDGANQRARITAHRERANEYGDLVLSGLHEAPVHLAVCCDTATARGAGLGRQTMPQTLRDSVVMAIYGFWLAARALDLGVGWVSILDPLDVMRTLELPEAWELVAYLAVGFPSTPSLTPELMERGWETRDARAVEWTLR